MRFLRFLVAALCLTSVALFAPPAGAATVTVGKPVWVNRPTPVPPTQVNRADCLAENAAIKFDNEVTPNDTANLFQVWSGTTCDMKMSRDNNTDCVMVADGKPESGEISVLIKDILQDSTSGAGKGTGTEETCSQATGASGGTMRSLFFIVVDQSNQESLGFGKWDFTFDLQAPSAPTAASIGPGEESLIVKLTASDAEDDLKTYRVYCAPDEGGCTSSVLVAGGDPPATGDCGSDDAKGSDTATGKGLSNGVSYAVAVAAEDELGNLSTLSEIQCGTPKEVTGFYEAYSAAGGQGGGGFCSFAPPRRGAATLALALLLGATTLLRRRR